MTSSRPTAAPSRPRRLQDLPEPLVALDLPLPRARSGKVRECFDLGDRLLLVASDRVSAFDVVFERGIPWKGAVLTGVSRFWFGALEGASGDGRSSAVPGISHHLLTTDAVEIVREAGLPPEVTPLLAGRTMLVRKTRPVPVECVVRGYLEGSALKDYEASGRVAGERLPPGLRRADRLPAPIFTPATKAQTGHDENITFDEMAQRVGGELAERLRDLSLKLYAMGADALAERGLLLADTKFEFGSIGGPEDTAGERILLIDEVLTPDSSRLWEASTWQPGRAQPSFDKQPLRDYLEELVREGRWDKRPPAPELSDEVVRATSERYVEAHVRITGRPPVGADGGLRPRAAPQAAS